MATLAVGKNHEVLLMMIRATAASAATASDTTTTSGLGIGMGSISNSFFVVFCSIIVYIPNSIQIEQKTGVKKILDEKRRSWKDSPMMGFGRSVGSV